MVVKKKTKPLSLTATLWLKKKKVISEGILIIFQPLKFEKFVS